jgi:hypothetical protein
MAWRRETLVGGDTEVLQQLQLLAPSQFLPQARECELTAFPTIALNDSVVPRVVLEEGAVDLQEVTCTSCR